MTREEAIEILEKIKMQYDVSYEEDALDLAIKALEQDTAPFDFELYQAGLMEMPKEMIEVLDKIRAEIEAKCCITVGRENDGAITLHDVFEIIDKYKSESEVKDADSN